MKIAFLLLILYSITVPQFISGFGDSKLADSMQYDHFKTRSLYGDILEELNGAHLRIAASHFPNVMVIETSPEDNGTFTYSGFTVDAVNYMAQAFNFTYSFVNSPKEDLKRLGPRESEIRLLLKNEVDITTTDAILYLSLFSRFDVSIPLYTAGVSIVTPWPEEESRLLAPIYPFQPTVWLVFIVVLQTMALVFTSFPSIWQKFIFIKTQRLKNNEQQSVKIFSVSKVSDSAFSIIANVTGHSGAWPDGMRKQKLFFKILLGSWLLATLVLVNAYSSLLISYLTIPKLVPVAKSFDDIAYHRVKNGQGISEKVGIGANLMFNASDDAYSKSKLFKRSQAFAEYYRRHPERLFSSLQEKFDLMFTGQFSYGSSEVLSYTFLDELNKKAGYCKFTISNKHLEDLHDYQRVFLYRKNWRYTDATRNKMQWWTDTGLAMHWIMSYQPSPKGCLLQDYKNNVPSIRVLNLKDLSSAFVILLMGCSLSLLVFLIEKIHFYRTLRQKHTFG